MAAERKVVVGWRVELPECMDPERPILHPAESEMLHASDGWTENMAFSFAAAAGGKVVARVVRMVAA